jgi:peptidoglycan/xylan/chitin deacetylase (PgdA/CDA1 family)
MSLPNTPVWTLMHLGLKFPGAAVIVGALYFVLAEDPKPMVAITFDDGRESVYTEALPLLSEYGFVATAYIPTEFVNRDGFVTTQQLLEIVSNEWEIGAHGTDHTAFTDLSPEELLHDLVYPIQYLPNVTGQEVLSVASPFGYYNDVTLEQIQKTYFNHVNAYSPALGLNTVENFDEYNIHRLDITEDITSEYLCNQIANLPNDSLFVTIVHNITDEPGRWNTSKDKLIEILDCIDQADVNVVRLSDGAQAMAIKQ